jgi:hypothetical protein
MRRFDGVTIGAGAGPIPGGATTEGDDGSGVDGRGLGCAIPCADAGSGDDSAAQMTAKQAREWRMAVRMAKR